MTARPQCSECDKQIDGELVWLRPFGNMRWVDAGTSEFVSRASNNQMENSLPFHPKCFEERTGRKWRLNQSSPLPPRARATHCDASKAPSNTMTI
jgi:hypothetical protein